jgi:hypothetical protein
MMPERSTVASLAMSAAYAVLIALLYFLSPGSSGVFVYQGY